MSKRMMVFVLPLLLVFQRRFPSLKASFKPRFVFNFFLGHKKCSSTYPLGTGTSLATVQQCTKKKVPKEEVKQRGMFVSIIIFICSFGGTYGAAFPCSTVFDSFVFSYSLIGPTGDYTANCAVLST